MKYESMLDILKDHGLDVSTSRHYSERIYILDGDIAIGYYNTITGKFECIS